MEFKKDILRLKNFIKETFEVELSDEIIRDIWKEYSEDFYAAGWLFLPEDINSLKDDRLFMSTLEKYFPEYIFLLFEDKNTTCILKKTGKINSLKIKDKDFDELLKYVPEIEKSYYQNIFKKRLFNKNFFVRFKKDDKNYIFYIIDTSNIEDINSIKDFLTIKE